MHPGIYFTYPIRSLIRGGVHTLLAIFCIAVGIMALVSLQLVGSMIENAFNVNVRDANGGDIAITAKQPFTKDNLAYFDTLKHNGEIKDYTATIFTTGELSLHDWSRVSFFVFAVNPTHFPLVSPPELNNSPEGTFAHLLTGNGVIVSQSFANQYHKKVGDSFDIHADASQGGSLLFHVKLAAIAADTSVLETARYRGAVILSLDEYRVVNASQPLLYDMLYVTTDGAVHGGQAAQDIQTQFPDASLQTPQDVLNQQTGQINTLNQFLEIAGLLTLLIGGVGIMNTMQVLLSRRRTEIAMLKAAGYRRINLVLLFGVETGLLGLIGGCLGAGTAIGMSNLVRNFVAQLFQIEIPFTLAPKIVVGGVVVGLATSLIFGLLPILQGSSVRPLNVLRNLPTERGRSSMIVNGGLLLVLLLLFCALATIILNNNILLAIICVFAALVGLGLLSLLLRVFIWLISRWPVPERLSGTYLLLVFGCIILAALLFLVQPACGVILGLVALLAGTIVLVPRSWKVSIKLALRNLGRQQGRTASTMLAQFVGIFALGLILVLGQNVRDALNADRSSLFHYNLIAQTADAETVKLNASIKTVPGLIAYQYKTIARTELIAINGKPLQTVVQNPGMRGTIEDLLNGVEGYDVGKNQLPSGQDFQITGRNLNASDANSDNVLVDGQLENMGQLHLNLGDKIILANLDHTMSRTVTIVGFYQQIGNSSIQQEPIEATDTTVKEFDLGHGGQSVFFLKVDPAQVSQAIDSIGLIAPNIHVEDLAVNNRDSFNSLLNNMLSTLTVIASLSLLAGVVFIANAVALAMLERRRETGILKAVGYTGRAILSEVLLENGVMGGGGAMLAMLIVGLVANLIGQSFLNSMFHLRGLNYQVSELTTVGLIVGGGVLAMFVAMFVAWGSVKLRPLEVLRYE